MGRFVVAIAVLVLGAGSVRAAEFTLGPVWILPQDTIACTLLNTGSKPLKKVEVHAQVIFSEGNTKLADEVASGSYVWETAKSLESTIRRYAFCRFKFKGGKNKVAATACVRTSSDRCDVVLSYP